MAKRTGPKPRSAKAKELEGEPDKRRRGGKEPRCTRKQPKRPTELDPAARKKWDELVDVLDELGLLNRADADLLEQYCRTYSRWRKCAVKCYKVGITTTGGAKLKPDARHCLELEKRLDSMRDELGLTPTSRARLGLAISAQPQGKLSKYG